MNILKTGDNFVHELEKSTILPIIAFLGIMFGAMAYALNQSKRRDIW